VNDDPEIELPDSFTFAEDESLTIDFADYIFDIDGDQLFLSVSGGVHVFASIDNYIVTLTALENWFGEEVLVFTVDDMQGRAIAQAEVIIIVTPVNDPPVLDLPEYISFNEDESLNFDISPYAFDIDNDDLIISSVDYNEENLFHSFSGLEIFFSAAANWFGSVQVNITISDQQLRATATDMIIIEVLPVNDAPEIDLPESFIFLEDESLTINLAPYINDIDNDELLLSISECEFIFTEINGLSVTFYAEADWYGEEELIFYLDDGQGRATAEDTALVIVEPVNDPPWLDLPAEIEIEQNESITIDISIYGGDIDSDELMLTIEAAEILYEIYGMQVMLTAPTDFSGTDFVSIWLSDGEFSVTDTICVIVNGICLTASYDLVQNWNWMSFNTLPEDAQIVSVLAELAGNAEQIKSQNISTTWFENWGWVGQLSELEAGRMYLLKMSEAYEGFTVTGQAAPLDMPVPLTTDWNWIGHLPQEAYTLADFMVPLEPNAIQMKAQHVSSTWFDNWGWVGQLDMVEPRVGYKLKMSQADTLIYGEQRASAYDRRTFSNDRQWQMAAGFENNMTLLGELSIDDIADISVCEAAFFDDAGICHGEGLYLGESGFWYFTIGGNLDHQPLTLRLKTDNAEEFTFEPQINFTANAITGEPSAAIVFTALMGEDDDNDLCPITTLHQCYPNPGYFSDDRIQINIPFSIAQPAFVEINIYNSRGQFIRQLVSHYLASGSHLTGWDGKDRQNRAVASGVYFYRMNSGKTCEQKKLLIIR
jgi:hypothetical protein